MDSLSAIKPHAVLIDGDNFPADLSDELFAAVSGLGAIAINRVYGSSSGIAGWRAAAAKHGIGLHEVMPGKNAADMRLAIDAMDILHRGKIKAFCIVSSDSDFAELARRLREDGVTVRGFGESKAAASFRRACDTFVPLDSPEAPKQIVQLSVAQPQAKTQTQKSAWPKLLAQVLVQLTPGTAQLTLSDLGQRVRQFDKTFSASKYGATNFKTLVIESGLQLSKVKSDWVVVVPKALRRAA